MPASSMLVYICFTVVMLWSLIMYVMAGAAFYYKKKPFDPTTSWRGVLLFMGLGPWLSWIGLAVMLACLALMLALAWKLFVVSLSSIIVSSLLLVITLPRLRK